MMHRLLSGTELSKLIREELSSKVSKYINNKNRSPGLATVLVGSDPASQVYVRNKIKACEAVGIRSLHHPLPMAVTETELLHTIDALNRNDEVDGILLQLPLPKGFHAERVLSCLDPGKDVDGFHPVHMGNLLLGRPDFLPCTPFGIIRLLESIQADWAGKHAVVIGRSAIVGKPVALLLLQKNMTVTICHSQTQDLPRLVAEADVLVAALGRAEFVKGDWLKEGAVVIDVGINRLADGRLVGDVHFDSAKAKAAYITPVPGGVGPMTIAMLMWNTVKAYEQNNSL